MNAAPAVYPWPIIVYFHHVGVPLPHYTSLSLPMFVRAIDLLEQHCDVAPAVELTRGPAAAIGSGRARVIVTFDDGYAETIETALPVLEARGISAAFFVPTADVGRDRPHPSLQVPVRHGDWSHLREVTKRGHIVASHAHDHESLALASAQVAVRQVTTSRALLDEHLGNAPDCFAYPFGDLPAAGISLPVARAFATVRADAAAWDCRPSNIRRVFLDSTRPTSWELEIASWTKRWREAKCAECGHSHAWQA